ncbi:MAG: TolC family outer membrane protein [Gammaproteobacteria bacterium]
MNTKFLATLSLLAGVALSLHAGGETLNQAMASAYRDNPQLQAARAGQRAAQKDIDAAKDGWYPNLALDAGAGRDKTTGEITFFPGPPFSATLAQSHIGVRLDQPIWHGGTISNKIDAAEDTASAVHAQTRAREAAVLLQAVRAYLGVVTTQAVLNVQTQNVETLRKQLDAAQQSLKHGEGTRTDVAQARARMEGALAARIQAQSRLAQAQADYSTVIGHPPAADLVLPQNAPPLPGSLQQAKQLASQNYQVTAARFNAQAANAQAASVHGKLLPKIGLFAEVVRQNNPEYGFARVTDRVIGLSVSVPIWQGGAVRDQTAAARERASEAELQTQATTDQARNEAVAAWQNYLAAGSTVSSFQAQLSAARIAYQGTRDEHRHGLRTLLDVLNAVQEMRNAQVSLVRAQGERIVAAYALLAATGSLTARRLKLPLAGQQTNTQ